MNLERLYIKESCENHDQYDYCWAKHSFNYRCSDQCPYYKNNGNWEEYQDWEDDYYFVREEMGDPYWNNGDFEDW